MCRYFLNISSTFYQYRENTDNRNHFGHYNRDNKSLICFASSGGASEAEDGGEQHASVCGERPPGSLAQLRRTGAAGRAETDRAAAGTRFISSFAC